jgi:hypothetical protein
MKLSSEMYFANKSTTDEAVDWSTAIRVHRASLKPIIVPWLESRSKHVRQPVMDFLFEYYSFPPQKLLTWNPGYNSITPREWTPSDKLYQLTSEGWILQANDFREKRISALDWLITLQQSILDRPKALGCFGLHEWAMVYKTTDVRHQQLPLRLSQEEIVSFLQTQTIRCSHFDAFRFFTPPAKPLNKLQPTYSRRIELEQGGCIHANMDLYKWCYKFWPWIPSTLLAKTFLLAVETRYFDMMASPYDLIDFGIEPIKIETEAGRTEYQQRQQSIANQAEILRIELVQTLQSIRVWLNN